MNINSFIVRIPKDLCEFFQYLNRTKKWTFATILREVVKTSPIYLEFSKENRG